MLSIKTLINKNRREVKDVFYLVALQGLNYIAPLLVLPYLIKILGAEKFGYIGFALAVCQYLMLIVDFGFNLSATKRIALAKDVPEKLNTVFSSTVYAKIILLLLTFFILILIFLIPQFAIYRTTMMVMFIMVVGQTFLFVFLFQGLGEIRWVSILNGIAKLSILPITFLLVKSPDDYILAALLQGLVSVVAAILSLILIYRRGWVTFVKFSLVNIFIELKESFPIFLSTAATSIYTACFVLILGYFSSPEEVGQYAAVDRIMRAFCLLVLAPLIQAFYPYLSRLRVECKSDAISILNKIFLVVVISMFIISIMLYTLSPFFIQFFGDGYQNTEFLFKIMAITPIFIGVGGVAGQLGLLAMGNKNNKAQFRNVYLVAGIVAMCLVFVLSPPYGAQGTAFALLLTEGVVCFGMLWFVRKLYIEK